MVSVVFVVCKVACGRNLCGVYVAACVVVVDYVVCSVFHVVFAVVHVVFAVVHVVFHVFFVRDVVVVFVGLSVLHEQSSSHCSSPHKPLYHLPRLSY